MEGFHSEEESEEVVSGNRIGGGRKSWAASAEISNINMKMQPTTKERLGRECNRDL